MKTFLIVCAFLLSLCCLSACYNHSSRSIPSLSISRVSKVYSTSIEVTVQLETQVQLASSFCVDVNLQLFSSTGVSVTGVATIQFQGDIDEEKSVIIDVHNSGFLQGEVAVQVSLSNLKIDSAVNIQLTSTAKLTGELVNGVFRTTNGLLEGLVETVFNKPSVSVDIVSATQVQTNVNLILQLNNRVLGGVDGYINVSLVNSEGLISFLDCVPINFLGLLKERVAVSLDLAAVTNVFIDLDTRIVLSVEVSGGIVAPVTIAVRGLNDALATIALSLDLDEIVTTSAVVSIENALISESALDISLLLDSQVASSFSVDVVAQIYGETGEVLLTTSATAHFQGELNEEVVVRVDITGIDISADLIAEIVMQNLCVDTHVNVIIDIDELEILSFADGSLIRIITPSLD